MTRGATADSPVSSRAPAREEQAAPHEGWRRALHAASAVLGPLSLGLPGQGGTLALGALAAVALGLEAARHTIPAVQRIIASVGRAVFRPEESKGISGPTALACGYLATWWLFEAHAATAAIVVSGLADPAAALVGHRWGRPGGKSLAGSMACAVTAAVVLLAGGRPPVTALVGAVAAALAERAPWRGADNLLVPLAVGGVLTILGPR